MDACNSQQQKTLGYVRARVCLPTPPLQVPVTPLKQERPRTVGQGETRRSQNVNAADLGATDLELCCPPLIMDTILLTGCPSA